MIRDRDKHAVDRLSLRIYDQKLEEAFKEDELSVVRPQMRIAMCVGIGLHLIHALFDPYFMAGKAELVSMSRWLPIVMGLASIALSFHRGFFAKYNQAIIFVVALVAVLHLAWSYMVMPQASVEAYYPAMLLALCWVFFFSGLRFTGAIFVCFLGAVFFNAGMIAVNNIGWLRIANLNFFIFSTFVITGFAAYLHEYTRRQLFLRSTRLDQERLIHQKRAMHDDLTGLANRGHCEMRIAAAINRWNRFGDGFGLLFIDLDGFKPINDRYGHATGDFLLQEIGNRLQHLIRDADLAARIGGDEFVVLLETAVHTEDLNSVVRKVVKSVSEPIIIEKDQVKRALSLHASIGGYVHTGCRSTPRDVLSAADFAMYKAKQRGKNRYELFDPLSDTWRLVMSKIEV